MPAGGSRLPASHETVDQRLHYVKQDGQAVFKFAVRKTEEICQRVLRKYGVDPSEVDLFVSHQANRRIIQAAADRLGLPECKVVINLERFGNTTAATIPLALADAVADEADQEGEPGAADVRRRRVHRRRRAAALGTLGTLPLAPLLGFLADVGVGVPRLPVIHHRNPRTVARLVFRVDLVRHLRAHCAQSGIIPCMRARRAASVRFVAPSLPQIDATWNLTV